MTTSSVAQRGQSAEGEQFHATGSRIIITPLDQERMRGGIYVPEGALETRPIGRVVSVGPGALCEQLAGAQYLNAQDDENGVPRLTIEPRWRQPCKVGDVIVFAHVEMVLEDDQKRKRFVIREPDVVGVLPDYDKARAEAPAAVAEKGSALEQLTTPEVEP